MKKIKKRLLPLMLALTLCLSSVMTVQAEGAAVWLIPPGVYSEYFVYSGYLRYGDGFSEGLMSVRDRNTGKYGYINTAGQLAIPCQYEDAAPFSDGAARVQLSNRNYAFINTAGQVLFSWTDGQDVSIDYSDVFVNEGFIRAYSSSTGTVKYGFMNTAGQLAVACQYGEVKDFSDGLAAVYDSANNYWGYIDAAGNVAIPFQYQEAEPFVGGYAPVMAADNWGTWMLIDKAGRNVIPDGYYYDPGYGSSNNFSKNGGVVCVTKKDLQPFLLDKAGQLKALDGVDWTLLFHEGYAWTSGLNDYFDSFTAYYDTTGREVFRTIGVVGGDFYNGYAVVDDGSGFVDTAGNLTKFPEGVEVKEIEDFGKKFSDGFLPVYSYATGTKRCGFVNTAGQLAIPCTYADVKPFSGGFAPVSNFDGKWGLVDAAGAQVLPLQYRRVEQVEGAPGLFFVEDYDYNAGLVVATP